MIYIIYIYKNSNSNLNSNVLFFQGTKSKRHKLGLSTLPAQTEKAGQFASVQLIRQKPLFLPEGR